MYEEFILINLPSGFFFHCFISSFSPALHFFQIIFKTKIKTSQTNSKPFRVTDLHKIARTLHVNHIYPYILSLFQLRPLWRGKMDAREPATIRICFQIMLKAHTSRLEDCGGKMKCYWFLIDNKQH